MIDLTSGGIEAAINTAFERGKFCVVAYNGEDGYPSLSFRGSTRVYSPTQLAVWARKPTEGLAAAPGHDPKVSVLYFGGSDAGPKLLSIQGTAHVADAETSAAFHPLMPQLEQEYGPVESGVVVIVDVTSVRGFGEAGAIEQTA